MSTLAEVNKTLKEQNRILADNVMAQQDTESGIKKLVDMINQQITNDKSQRGDQLEEKIRQRSKRGKSDSFTKGFMAEFLNLTGINFAKDLVDKFFGSLGSVLAGLGALVARGVIFAPLALAAKTFGDDFVNGLIVNLEDLFEGTPLEFKFTEAQKTRIREGFVENATDGLLAAIINRKLGIITFFGKTLADLASSFFTEEQLNKVQLDTNVLGEDIKLRTEDLLDLAAIAGLGFITFFPKLVKGFIKKAFTGLTAALPFLLGTAPIDEFEKEIKDSDLTPEEKKKYTEEYRKQAKGFKTKLFTGLMRGGVFGLIASFLIDPLVDGITDLLGKDDEKTKQETSGLVAAAIGGGTIGAFLAPFFGPGAPLVILAGALIGLALKGMSNWFDKNEKAILDWMEDNVNSPEQMYKQLDNLVDNVNKLYDEILGLFDADKIMRNIVKKISEGKYGMKLLAQVFGSEEAVMDYLGQTEEYIRKQMEEKAKILREKQQELEKIEETQSGMGKMFGEADPNKLLKQEIQELMDEQNKLMEKLIEAGKKTNLELGKQPKETGQQLSAAESARQLANVEFNNFVIDASNNTQSTTAGVVTGFTPNTRFALA